MTERIRNITTTGIILNLLSNFVGLGLIIYFGNLWVEGVNHKFDSIFKNEMCLTKSIYACCSEKASVNC